MRPFMWMMILLVGVGFWIGILVAPLTTIAIISTLLLLESIILVTWKLAMPKEEKGVHENSPRINLKG